jgi:hypothetical protein
MVGYAYRDKFGILHIVSNEEVAKEYAFGEYKEVDCEYAGGFPKVNGKKVFDYGNGEVYVGGNKGDGIPLDELEEKNPDEAEAVKELLEKIGL